MHLDGGLQLALTGAPAVGALGLDRAFFDHGIDDVGLTTGRNLLAHKLPHFLGAFVADQARGDGRAPRRQLVEHAGVEVAVERERQGPRNGRRGHHQHIGLGDIIRIGGVGLLHQAKALHHAEAMLLVDDDQAELVELDCLLNERMRADHQLRVALRDVMTRLLLAARLLRAGEQHDAIAGGFENAPRR